MDRDDTSQTRPALIKTTPFIIIVLLRYETSTPQKTRGVANYYIEIIASDERLLYRGLHSSLTIP